MVRRRPDPDNDLVLMDLADDLAAAGGDPDKDLPPDALWIWVSPSTGVESAAHVAFTDRSTCEAANRFRPGRAVAFYRN